MKRTLADCLAANESLTWLAFPEEFTRGEVIGALSEDATWWDTLKHFAIKRGFVVQGVQDGGAWYWEAEAGDADAIPAWIAKAR